MGAFGHPDGPSGPAGAGGEALPAPTPGPLGANYDVVVVGGGHAGAEAAAAAARMRCRTLLVTPDLNRIGQMSCNPAIGGVAKGTVAREIDAMGGLMGLATDEATLHFRMLNRSKGPAVWGPRAQCDRDLYPVALRRLLEATPGLDLLQGTVEALVLGNGVEGVVLEGGMEVGARSVVVTAGTFLRGRIPARRRSASPAGRAGEPAVESLAEALALAGVTLRRFKTGTPPRVDGRTVRLEGLERQDGEDEDFRFSFRRRVARAGALPCWLAWTGEALKSVVVRNLERSALYGGEISGRGPRYCPSIEDKVVRFPDAPRHKVFLEPEGLRTTELYVNGLSTSLPPEIQLAFLRTVPGLEEVRVTRFGYAIEYDYLPPEQLHASLEVRQLPGLFTAGQVNGTTGYEEAAGQGIVAGINAALRVQGRPPWVPRRARSYLGVLVGDLVTRGVTEPYRLFTSRAEFRILLRQDNAPERLGDEAESLGLLDDEARALWKERKDARRFWEGWIADARVMPGVSEGMPELGPVPCPTPLRDLLRRPQLEVRDLEAVAKGGGLVQGRGGALEPGGFARGLAHLAGTEGVPEGTGLGGMLEAGRGARRAALEAVALDFRYAGYQEREEMRAARVERLLELPIPPGFDFERCEAISGEAREAWGRLQPRTVAEAAGVPGARASDVQNLALHVRRRRGEGGQKDGEDPEGEAG